MIGHPTVLLHAFWGLMPARYLLERDYQRTEYEPACGLQL
jgi:hypothetical protein